MKLLLNQPWLHQIQRDLRDSSSFCSGPFFFFFLKIKKPISIALSRKAVNSGPCEAHTYSEANSGQ